MSETVSSGVQPYMFELESENGAYRAIKKKNATWRLNRNNLVLLWLSSYCKKNLFNLR